MKCRVKLLPYLLKLPVNCFKLFVDIITARIIKCREAVYISVCGVDIDDIGLEVKQLLGREEGFIAELTVFGSPELGLYAVIQQKQLKNVTNCVNSRAAEDSDFFLYPACSVRKKLSFQLSLPLHNFRGIERVCENVVHLLLLFSFLRLAEERKRMMLCIS